MRCGTVAVSVVIEGARQQVAALGRDFLEDLGGGRRLVVDGLDFIGCKVLVVDSLQTEGNSSNIMRVDAKVLRHLAPEQLFLRDLVIAAILYNVVEDLEEVDMGVADFWFGVEFGASLVVELSEFVDEVFVLGRAVNRMFSDYGGRLGGRHGRRSGPRQTGANGLEVQPRVKERG